MVVFWGQRFYPEPSRVIPCPSLPSVSERSTKHTVSHFVPHVKSGHHLWLHLHLCLCHLPSLEAPPRLVWWGGRVVLCLCNRTPRTPPNGKLLRAETWFSTISSIIQQSFCSSGISWVINYYNERKSAHQLVSENARSNSHSRHYSPHSRAQDRVTPRALPGRDVLF